MARFSVFLYSKISPLAQSCELPTASGVRSINLKLNFLKM